MESVRFAIFLIISIAALGLAEQWNKRDTPANVGLQEPAEEDQEAEGAVEGDEMLTDEQKNEFYQKASTQNFDAERSNEPAEEDASPGAHESDMMLTPNQEAGAEGGKDGSRDKRNVRTKRKGMGSDIWRWPYKTVTYKISPEAKKYNEIIMKAIKQWETYTCLKFKKATNKVFKKVGHQNYVLFDGVPDSTGCASWIGYLNNGEQKLNLTDKCTGGNNGLGTVMHEIGHTIGFVHEQSRPDRDKYVTIHEENVEPYMANNFKKLGTNEVDTQDIPYDHSSVMHYGSHYGSRNNQPTIEVRDINERLNMGQRLGFSRYDIKLANVMYECPEVNECEELSPCQNDAVCIDEPGTYHCECTEGWRGLNCDIGCEDQHEDCNYFMGNGDCTGGEFHGWMLINCQKSCGICAPYVCRDIETNCDFAADQGACEEGSDYNGWAKANCQKKCGFCNYCSPSPCLNGGTCNQFGIGFKCACPEGYSGENCQIPSTVENPPTEAPAVDDMVDLGNGFCMVPCRK